MRRSAKEERPALTKPLDEFTPDDVLIGIEDGPPGGIDMTGEPWWKRLLFKVLRIT